MYEILRLLFGLCIFNKKPQDLPYSPFLLKLIVLANLLVAMLIGRIDSSWLLAISQALVSITMGLSFCWLSLYFCGKRSRLNQTLSAFLGVDMLISFFSIPAMATLSIGQGGLTVVLLLIGLIGWHWAVIGHIMRHALSQSLSFGFGVALLYLMASYYVMVLLFPEIPKSG